MNLFLPRLTPLLAAAFIIGCSDGPEQTFSASPEGAGSIWNNGNSAPATLDAGQQFDAAYPTTGKTTLCSTDLKRERWSWMLQQPVIPPRFYAGLDMAKSDLWEGLSIGDAESPPTDPNMTGGGLCQSVPLGAQGGCPSGIGNCNLNYWGNNKEVQFSWNVGTGIVDQMTLNLGYTGVMTFKSRDGAHTYELKIGDVPKKDGAAFLIDWNGHPNDQITELFNAAMITFGPTAGIPWPTDSTDCGADGNCLVYNASGQTIFGFRPLVIYVVGVSGVPQPALSTPTQFYNFFAKFEPYGNLPQDVNLDPNGPIATGVPAGARDNTVICTQKIGVTFGQYLSNCIQVNGPVGSPDAIDIVNTNKVENGLTHDQEHWAANVVGVNQNFTSSLVANNPNIVVQDGDKPQAADIGQDFFFDLRAKGHPRNDYNASDALDLRGSALLYVEWANLMLNDINAQLKATGAIPKNQPPMRLGDPKCTGHDAAGNPNFAPGCSGIEGLIIPYVTGTSLDFTKDASCVNPNTCLDPGKNWDTIGLYGYSQIKPGDKIAAFCVDPGTFTDCIEPSNSPFYAAQQWVVRFLGKGNVATLPPELQDRRYYYKWFGVAFVKYLKAYSDFPQQANRDNWPCSPVFGGCSAGGPGPTDLVNQYVDLESLFFDNNYSAAFDKFEYIDRENIGKGQEGTVAQSYNYIPWDFEYGIDLIAGNQRYDNWYRRMDREEIAMFASMLVNKADTPGMENNINLTNLFGSSVVAGVWPSYQCAIGAGGDPLSKTYACSGPPPLDSSNMTPCTSNNMCPAGQQCVTATTYENGVEQVCGSPCNFGANALTGCAKPNQTCVLSTADSKTEACVDMLMDLNGPSAPSPHPFMYYYPSVWSRTPFALGHSPITLAAADKHPEIGVAKISIPNYLAGPYTNSPQVLVGTTCPAGWTLDDSGKLCYAPLNTGTGILAPSFTPLTPWLEVQQGVGFSFPIDGQHDQFVATGQLDFTGVLETYKLDYTPWADTVKPSCIGDGVCGQGYTCDKTSSNCYANDNTLRVMAIEADDFLGAVFACQDPLTGDLLHVRQYDSALRILNWLAAHPGGWSASAETIQPGAQTACQIIIRYSPYNNYIDYITAKTNGVKLAVNQGAGLGRIVNAIVYDSSITQTP